MTSEEEALKLVELVEARPCLWNPRNAFYANKNVTDRNWREVAVEMKIPEKECKKRWTNIRTVFRRHLNQRTPSGTASGAKKAYYLHESLQFLVPVIQTKTSEASNLDATEGVENNDGETVSNESEGGDNNDDPVSPPPDGPEEDEAESQLTAGNENQESRNNAEPNTSNTSDFRNNTGRPNRKKKDPVGAAIIDYLANKKKKASDTPKPEYDGDEKFLLSLKDDMKEMTPSQKRTFKRRILEVVEDTLQERSSSSSGTFHPISVSTSRSTTPGQYLSPPDYYQPSPSLLVQQQPAENRNSPHSENTYFELGNFQ